ncbi:MAG: hypothetical protein AAGC78_14995 [Cellvibrio sp.]|uniref:hypothetical protein n=1 Tax=Cellvibrio sp. TaxID=1965322 RepID=UPI0031A24E32
MKPLFFIVFLTIVSGCAANNKAPLEVALEKERAVALAKIDSDACKKIGGKVEPIGLYELPKCVIYYPDGGTSCISDADCLGMCVTREMLDAKTPARGICERSEHDHFGCYSAIEDGKVLFSICAD